MATLLVVGSSNGARRCDATCHNASGTRCVCVCGGRYHGAGDAGALRQVREDVLGEDGADLLEQLERDGVKLTKTAGEWQLELEGLAA